MPIISAFRMLKQKDYHEFKINLRYIINTRPVKAI